MNTYQETPGKNLPRQLRLQRQTIDTYPTWKRCEQRSQKTFRSRTSRCVWAHPGFTMKFMKRLWQVR